MWIFVRFSNNIYGTFVRFSNFARLGFKLSVLGAGCWALGVGKGLALRC